MKSRTRADKIANLEILILSSAFSQAEADRTQAWLADTQGNQPQYPPLPFSAAWSAGLAIEEGRREVTQCRDKADSH